MDIVIKHDNGIKVIRKNPDVHEIVVAKAAVYAAEKAEQAAIKAEAFASNTSFVDESLYIDLGDGING